MARRISKGEERAMKRSAEINEISKALAEAQGEFKSPPKDKTVQVRTKDGGNYSYQYADLAVILDCIREPMAKHGLAVAHAMGKEDGTFGLFTTLLHSSGQWLQTFYPMQQSPDPKQMGSGITYARRYSLCALIGIAADEDDDAETAHVPPKQKTTNGGAPVPPKAVPPKGKASPKPGAASGQPSPSAAKPSGPSSAVPGRDALNRQMMNLYRPFLSKFPETKFVDLLKSMYGVGETRLMSVEQVAHLVQWMDAKIKDLVPPAPLGLPGGTVPELPPELEQPQREPGDDSWQEEAGGGPLPM
jgi:hypothetical protein